MPEGTELPIQEILSNLGLNLIDCGDYWKFRSPWRADNDPSCICYKSSGYVIDFGGNFRGGMKRFVFAVTGKSFDKEFPGLSSTTLDWGSRGPRTVTSRTEPRIPTISISGRIDRVYDNPDALRYCYSRHMTDAIIKDFELSYLSWGTLNGSLSPWTRRLLIPVKEAGNTLSIEGRDITRQQEKKALYPRGCTTNTLFNFDRLDRSKPLVVVEGIMDLIPVYQVTQNVTSVFGISITQRQKQLLKSFPDLILLPDSDDGGERFIDTVDEFYEEEFRVARVPEKDPGDSTLEHIRAAIEGSQGITRYLMEKTDLLPRRQKLLW
jgi:DNA primase